MPDQPLAIHQKLGAFGLASKDGMIVEHKAGLPFASLALKDQPRRQPADASTHNHAIVDLSSVDHIGGKTLEQPIANLVPGLEHCARIAVRVRIVPNAAVTSPVVDCTGCRGSCEQP